MTMKKDEDPSPNKYHSILACCQYWIANSIPTNIIHDHVQMGCCHLSYFILHVVKLLQLRSYDTRVYCGIMKLRFKEQNIFCL